MQCYKIELSCGNKAALNGLLRHFVPRNDSHSSLRAQYLIWAWQYLVLSLIYLMSMKQPAVYILASHKNGTLYTGVTSDLVKRVWEHKQDLADGFTKRYQVHTLVYYELYEDILSAINREKQIKAGSRNKKILLIESVNVDWLDLYETIV